MCSAVLCPSREPRSVLPSNATTPVTTPTRLAIQAGSTARKQRRRAGETLARTCHARTRLPSPGCTGAATSDGLPPIPQHPPTYCSTQDGTQCHQNHFTQIVPLRRPRSGFRQDGKRFHQGHLSSRQKSRLHTISLGSTSPCRNLLTVNYFLPHRFAGGKCDCPEGFSMRAHRFEPYTSQEQRLIMARG